jgi:hypothetical protein
MSVFAPASAVPAARAGEAAIMRRTTTTDLSDADTVLIFTVDLF